VDRVSLTIPRGRVLGLIGESGSGKTTIGRAMLGLVPPTRGCLVFDGLDVSRRSRSQARRLSTRIQAVFQDTSGALDPRMSIKGCLDEALRRSPDRGRSHHARSAELLGSVGLGEDVLARFPQELSGGQRQRVGIARALAVEPDFVVCDEPTASLDVSVQAQVLNLLAALRDRLGLTYLFIGHNIAVVRYLSDAIAVMYAGRLVEYGPTELISRHPAHPYTQALVSAVADRPVAGTVINHGPSTAAAAAETAASPGGCPVRHSCSLTVALGRPTQCAEEAPMLRDVGEGRRIACHYAA